MQHLGERWLVTAVIRETKYTVAQELIRKIEDVGDRIRIRDHRRSVMTGRELFADDHCL